MSDDDTTRDPFGTARLTPASFRRPVDPGPVGIGVVGLLAAAPLLVALAPTVAAAVTSPAAPALAAVALGVGAALVRVRDPPDTG